MNHSDNSTEKSSILIVDDNPDNLRILTDILSRGGYKVRAALDGLLALRSLENAKPDLILLDIVMPEIDGYQVCEQVKANPHLKDIPVIFVSALHEVFDKVKAFALGGVDFITKPFKAEEVLARVRTHLEIYYLQNALKAKNLALEQEIAEHKKSQQQLRQSEERFRTLVNILPHGIVEVDVTGMITFSNMSYNQIFGFKAGELNDTPFWMLATDTENFQFYFNQLILEQPQPVPYISIQKCKEGRLIHVQIDWDYRRDNEGQLMGLVAVVTDITERIQAEKALRKEREFIQIVLDTEPNFVFVKDKKGYFIMVNKAMANFFNTTPELLISKHHTEIMVHPEEYQFYHQIEQQALHTMKTIEVDETYTTRNGHTLSFHSFKTPLTMPDGTVHLLGIAINITARKHAEEALRFSEEKFRQFFENAPEYCFMVSPNNIILGVNKTACQVLGYWKEELIGKPIGVIYAPESLPNAYQLIKSWKGVNQLLDKELTIIGRMRERHTVLLSANTVRDKEKKVTLLIYVLRDITERKQIEAALKASERRYRLLIANLPNTAVILLDRRLKILIADGEEMTKNNLDKTQLEGKFLYEALPTDLKELFEPVCQKALAGSATTFEKSYNNYLYIHQVLPIQDDVGDIGGCMIVLSNITTHR